MRFILRFAIVVLFLTGLSQVALAQQAGGPPAPGTTGKTAAPEQFQDRKARILKMIDERRANLDKARACIEAASNNDELRKCRPERPEGMGPGRRHGGPGRQPMGPGDVGSRSNRTSTDDVLSRGPACSTYAGHCFIVSGLPKESVLIALPVAFTVSSLRAFPGNSLPDVLRW